MNKQNLSLTGVYTPIVTPFDANGSVAHEKLVSNLEKWNQTGLKGYIVLGSNGENVHLSEQEMTAVLDTARQAIPKDKLMVAGTGAQSTRATISLTEQAAAIGADLALVIHPSYYKGQMTGPVLVEHYRMVADVSPIPIMIYNLPPATGIDIPADVLVELSHHPNIIGVKDTSGNIPKMAETIRRAGPAFNVLAGSANFFFPSLAFGVKGGILALANIAPNESVAMYNHFMAGEMEKGRELYLRMLPVNQAVTGRFGISGLKAAMDMLGFYGGSPRRPLLPLDDIRREELAGILKTGGLEFSSDR
ncbi:MAG: dihydrodipicolinate synthase family protein [Anaerolineales bacterium]|nr:dihydrodipicolinate synthase family protein [Anaerolineales bacterium]